MGKRGNDDGDGHGFGAHAQDCAGADGLSQVGISQIGIGFEFDFFTNGTPHVGHRRGEIAPFR